MSRKTVRTPVQTRQGGLNRNTLAILCVSLLLAVIAGVWAYKTYFMTGYSNPSQLERSKT